MSDFYYFMPNKDIIYKCERCANDTFDCTATTNFDDCSLKSDFKSDSGICISLRSKTKCVRCCDTDNCNKGIWPMDTATGTATSAFKPILSQTFLLVSFGLFYLIS